MTIKTVLKMKKDENLSGFLYVYTAVRRLAIYWSWRLDFIQTELKLHVTTKQVKSHTPYKTMRMEKHYLCSLDL